MTWPSDPQVLETAVAGADAVLSTLGPHNNSDAGIAAPATRAIITAMRAAGGRRIVDSISLRIVVLFLGWLIS